MTEEKPRAQRLEGQAAKIDTVLTEIQNLKSMITPSADDEDYVRRKKIVKAGKLLDQVENAVINELGDLENGLKSGADGDTE